MTFDLAMCLSLSTEAEQPWKLLHAEDGGMVLYIKRLEEGTFRLPSYDSESRSYPMEWRDLVLMVEGITDNPSDRLKRLKAGRKEGFY